ncbi:MAG: hypothetical protein UV73_C0008G0023 [Candidatus Gottesmanbacteria bacterium GW2011_GWA2_43_14]|uniref:Uncharacterized protein n=1 Tax=Candidatus Gottesmanbacteria bacterium GW2011_GWA2_43_14 TaxID=1618443 RepID=A0A0G1GF58_9BACT|nr:MAG: hypothetical protein UV73_C0008G0023 [Candidatus Gottesmanbacteria bacterium GW2011_GWA2_43_14]
MTHDAIKVAPQTAGQKMDLAEKLSWLFFIFTSLALLTCLEILFLK